MLDLDTRPLTSTQLEAKRLKVLAEIESVKNMRLMGAAITGPAMIYTGLEKKLPPWLKAIMVTVGVGIIASNIQHLTQQQNKNKM